jgi:hypothetical protein
VKIIKHFISLTTALVLSASAFAVSAGDRHLDQVEAGDGTSKVSIDFSKILDRRMSLINRTIHREFKSTDIDAEALMTYLVTAGYQRKTGEQLAQRIKILITRIEGKSNKRGAPTVSFDLEILDADGNIIKSVSKNVSASRMAKVHYRKYGSNQAFGGRRLGDLGSETSGFVPMLSVASDAAVELLSESK